jgi:hypothetical protein
MIRITLELDPVEAAALHRLCDKLGHSDAMHYLYPHVNQEVRSRQAYQMVHAAAAVQNALEDTGINHWPWIETGVTD